MESYTRHQETVNGVIHVFGILFGIAGIPLLASLADTHGNKAGLIGSCIYGFCFLLVFTSSTIYHFARERKLKHFFKILDHIGIYFFIAGTYTPFLLIYMPDAFGRTLLIVLWTLTLAGTIFKSWFTGRFEIISTAIYLAMGWIMLVGGRRFFDQLPHAVMVYVCIGAALYTIGAFFYLWDKYKYTHALWHVLVLTAAVCHYVAVLKSV
ncbi:MAG TPA: hemolysin III family protein [Puia sp.]|nr:hemolysin III family protein [Puia sp.]